MKNLKLFSCFVLLFISSSLLVGQSDFADYNFLKYNKNAKCNKIVDDYSECAAIFFNDKMLVDNYSPKGSCQLEMGMRGKLSVSTIELSNTSHSVIQPIYFRVAIKNEATNTMWMYSAEMFKEVLLEDVLKECQPDDKIIIMTEDKRFSLPHHEINLVWGC